MLGDISSEECVALMRLIETQSKSTLSKWAIEYARRNYLTVYQRHCADDHTIQSAAIAGEANPAKISWNC